MLKFRIKIGDFGEEDKERAVLPAIIWTRSSLGIVQGRVIAIGWWKWGIRIIILSASNKDVA